MRKLTTGGEHFHANVIPMLSLALLLLTIAPGADLSRLLACSS
jgi:hypothetical protein